MKFRSFDSDIELNPETIKEPENLYSKSYTIKVITPIYGGGVVADEPDKEMPIRASAIRGQMRYWWRFLQMNHPDNQEKRKEDDEKFIETLFKKEREIWGGMGDTKELLKKESDYSSKVFIRIFDIEKCSINNYKQCGHYNKNRKEKDGKVWFTYPFVFDHNIPDYSLFCAQGKPPKQGSNDPEENPHEVVLPNPEFKLELFTNLENEENWNELNEAFRWWACFGGLGARTRRGLGSVEILDKKFKSLEKDDVKKYGCELRTIEASNPNEAWAFAINKLKHFRQAPEGRKGIGRSKWPEPDSLRDITAQHGHPIEHGAIRSFPRAAFGMPIIFEIRGNGEPPKTEISPKGDIERMASPLILKAMACEDGYKAIALLLPHDHLKTLETTLKYVNFNKDTGYEKKKKKEHKSYNDKKELKALEELKEKLPLSFSRSKKDKNIWWPNDEECQKIKSQQTDPLRKNNANNPLTAFMNFFVSKTEDNNG